MSVEKWSDNVVVVRLADIPHSGDDLDALEQVIQQRRVDAVIDFSGVRMVNSTSLAKLLKIRKQMNAATPEGEMAWMSPELVTWYQAENARRLEAQIQYEQQVAAQQREENRIVRRAESCSLSCKERGLRCQNSCEGDVTCENRCVEINHACVDRCVVHARAELGD